MDSNKLKLKFINANEAYLMIKGGIWHLTVAGVTYTGRSLTDAAGKIVLH